ncbi:MAG: acyl-CoA reductase [Bacteroidota bacterium]
MEFERRKEAFLKLGTRLRQELKAAGNEDAGRFKQALLQAYHKNAWFVPFHVEYAMNAIANCLIESQMSSWLNPYQMKVAVKHAKKVAVITAGNIPAVGFHDFLSVLISGNIFIGKLSSQDEVLLPLLADMLVEIEPGFADYIQFKSGTMKDFDAVIATGSNNTARYFEYYFGKYPHIIRKNRNAVAILNGNENSKTIEALGKDIFLYFGLGCRNVSKVYAPQGFMAADLLSHFDAWKYVADHHKYMNNYDYFKSIYLINREEFFDNGFLLLKNEVRIASPVSVLFYETYNNRQELFDHLIAEAENIQCVVGEDLNRQDIAGIATAKPGQAQQPALWDYADNMDTLAFLQKITSNKS